MRSLRFGVLVAAAALAVAACGSSGSSSSAPSASAAAGGACTQAAAGTTAAATVTIRDFAFDPGSVTIKAGETVAWTNQDSATHTATTLDGGCDTSSIAKGATVALTFPAAGTYTYHCKIHATMPQATVVVTP